MKTLTSYAILTESRSKSFTATMKTLTSYAILTKSLSKSMFRLTDFALRAPAGFRKPLVYYESGFQKPLRKATGGFQLAGHDCENTFSFTAFSHT
jgi:hypothetical protein